MAKIPDVKNLFVSIDGEFLILKTRFEKFIGETKAGNSKVCGMPFTKLADIEGLDLPPGYSLMLQLVYKAPKEVEADAEDDEDEAPVAKKPTSKKTVAAAPAKKAAVTAPTKKVTKATKKAPGEADDEEKATEAEDEHEVTSPLTNRNRRRRAA